jgi:xanthine dehydrogenase iron-sulfur cluster and FAD-binding subunit A
MPRLSANARHTVHFALNGRAVAADAQPRMLLTDFLRHDLGMTGVHVGCEHGVCGACTIEIDGVPAPSRRWRPSRAGFRSCRRRSGATMRCNAASVRPAS